MPGLGPGPEFAGGGGEPVDKQHATPKQKKPKCKQDPNGGDIPEIKDYMARAGLTGLIDPLSIQRSREGITFTFINRADTLTFLNNSPSFRGPNIWPLNSQHTGQVSGSAQDFRSYTIGTEALGPKSLQVEVGPNARTPGGGQNLATGYADLDRSNPAQDVVSLFKHMFGH